jgi:spermidine synthase
MDVHGASMMSNQSGSTRLIFACFFISGVAGLIYEVLWIRMLGLIFGHTVYAITTVLVAFMGGLALGSYLCGRSSDRINNLLRTYGLLEVGIGAYCILIPWLMKGMGFIYVSIVRSVELPFSIFTLLQFTFALLILLVPTTLMGATLPILSRFFVRDLSSVGGQVGKLYAFNTFGAVLGTYLAGFELLPVMGITLTLLIAAILNIGVGTLVLCSPHQSTRVAPRRPVSNESGSFGRIKSWDKLRKWLLVGFTLSGAVSMIYEIAWTRALNLVIGSSTYAFSAILLSFLVGIASGSALFSRYFRNSSITLFWFAVLQLGVGTSAALCYPLFQKLPELFVHAFGFSHSYDFILTLEVLICLGVMILPTVFIGATFPCAAQLVSRELSGLGRDVGRIYACNTSGAIVGSFLTGFFLIPSIGVDHSIKAAIAINLLIGLVLCIVYFQKSIIRISLGLAIAMAGLAVFFLPTWDHFVMSSGASVYAQDYLQDINRGSFQESLRKYKVLFYKDGVGSTVSVHQDGENNIFLRVNGKTDASTVVDMHTQLMLGHIPALLHPHLRTALVVGLGSGVTVGALTQYDPERVDVVEIEPAVVEAASFFKKENRHALDNPRVKVVTASARNYLLTTTQKYDLIVSEPSNPWIKGVASLFTVESFNLAREHLNPDGIMAQWFHGYGMAPEDLEMVVASFRWVFPNATLWVTSQTDFILIGSLQPIKIDLDRIRSAYKYNPMLREDLQQLNLLSPEAILSDFYLDEDDLGRFAAGADLNTDDRLPLEFSSPRSLYEDTGSLNLMVMRRAKKSKSPDLLGVPVEELNRPDIQYNLAMGYDIKGMKAEALEHLRAALTKDPNYAPALLERGRLKMDAYNFVGAIGDFKSYLKDRPRSAEAHHLLGLIYMKQKKFHQAVNELTQAIHFDSMEPVVYVLDLATAYRRIDRYEEAVDQYRLALKQQPQNQRIMGALGASLVKLDRPTDAVEVLERAIVIDPNDHRLRYQLGQAYLLLGRDRDSQRAFEAAIALNPRDAEPYVGLGKVWLALGDRDRAAAYFKSATRLNRNISIPNILVDSGTTNS